MSLDLTLFLFPRNRNLNWFDCFENSSNVNSSGSKYVRLRVLNKDRVTGTDTMCYRSHYITKSEQQAASGATKGSNHTISCKCEIQKIKNEGLGGGVGREEEREETKDV